MEAVTFKEEEARTPQTIRPLDPNPNPHDLLPDGAVLLLSADGTVLAHGAPLPPPFPASTSFAGQPVQQVGPPSLGNCLHRLFKDSQQSHRPCMAEIITGWEAHNPTSHVALSVRVSPHPQQPDLRFVTARNLTKDRDRVQDLLDVIEVLREQRDEWEATARVVAHDVRSSVSAMTGFVKLALHRPGRMSSHASHHLQQALEFGNRLFSLVEMMVDKARGRRHESERIELGPFGLRLFTALRAAHPAEALTWCVDAADHAVRAPAPLLWDAVWNLLDNAMKYRREDRSLEVHLRAWREHPYRGGGGHRTRAVFHPATGGAVRRPRLGRALPGGSRTADRVASLGGVLDPGRPTCAGPVCGLRGLTRSGLKRGGRERNVPAPIRLSLFKSLALDPISSVSPRCGPLEPRGCSYLLPTRVRAVFWFCQPGMVQEPDREPTRGCGSHPGGGGNAGAGLLPRESSVPSAGTRLTQHPA
jgi:hypothetical protein